MLSVLHFTEQVLPRFVCQRRGAPLRQHLEASLDGGTSINGFIPPLHVRDFSQRLTLTFMRPAPWKGRHISDRVDVARHKLAFSQATIKDAVQSSGFPSVSVDGVADGLGRVLSEMMS